ncbi:MAG: hypothetical protein LiPW15_389 [Parcubacteria group bacterium LiPW_15]|nr:MAG: hypothetical protein LiPW15_389 [Parcubacteria group bacterium LiPW_15]
MDRRDFCLTDISEVVIFRSHPKDGCEKIGGYMGRDFAVPETMSGRELVADFASACQHAPQGVLRGILEAELLRRLDPTGVSQPAPVSDKQKR